MTPPLLRPFGHLHGGTLSLTAEQVHNFQPTPEFRALTRSLLTSRELVAEQGRSIFATGTCHDNPDCRPDLSRLPDAVAQTRAQSENDPAFYRLSLNFLAAQFMNTTDEAERARLQTQAREIARQALDRVSDPSFEPAAEDANRRELPLRTRARMLFNIASTLSALLARPQAETYSQEDRALLRDYFVRTRTLVTQLQERKRIEPGILGWPEYFDHYLQAQIALIDGQNQTAFSELIRTRQLVREIPAESRSLPLPTQIRAATEFALQSIPRTGTGGQVESLRNLISLESLGFVDQTQYLQSHGEDAASDAAKRSQSLSLVAAAYLQAGHNSPNATSLLQFLRTSENSAELRQILDDRLRSDGDLRSSLAATFPGDLNSAEVRSRAVNEIVELARNSADSILTHANQEPYRTIFAHDRDSRPISHAIDTLTNDSALTETLRRALDFGPNVSAEEIVRDLVSHGENLETLLGVLPETTRTSVTNRIFFRELRQAALGLEGDGMRVNLEQPLLDMVESLHGLAQHDDANAAAYFAIFETLRNLQQVGPGHTLPPSLRQIAANHAADLQNFSASRVVRHLTAPSSLGMMAGGIVLSELAPIWLLRGARIPFFRSAEAAAAVRSTGEMGVLMRGGRLTGWGEAVAGLGVGLAMHLGSVGAHVVSVRGTNVSEYGQELQNLGLRNLALGTLFSMGALGATMGISHLLRGRLLPTGAALSPSRLALGGVGLRLTNWGFGGAFMIGAHSATSAISGHSAMPTGEQAAEVFLSMAMWDAASAGLRVSLPRLFPSYARHQMGPFRAEQVVQNRLELILQRNPELSSSRRFLQDYLRTQNGRAEFGRIGRALEEGRIPRIEGRGDGRRLVFDAAAAPTEPTAAARPAEAAPRPAAQTEMTRTEAARTVMELNPDQQTMVRQILNSSALVSPEHPNGIHVIREAIRERLANGERNPSVWVRVERQGRHISFEALPAEPAASDRDGTFRMDSSGKINTHFSVDPVIRAVIAGYNNNAELSSAILPPSAGADAFQSAGPDEPTGAHRRPPQLPRQTAAADSDAAEPAASDAPAAPVEAEPSAPAETRSAEEIRESTPEIESADSGEVDMGSTTAPVRPDAELLAAARRTGAGIRPFQPNGTSRPARGDQTARFTPDQAARARRDSRPRPQGAPAPAQPSEPERFDATATLQLTEAQERELRQRLGPQIFPDGSPPSRESEPPMEIRDEEAQFDELEPIPDNPAEIDFSGIDTDTPSDSTPTIPPPAGRPVTETRTVARPPPLPSRRDLQASAEQGSGPAPFPLLRRQVREVRPVLRSSDQIPADETSAVRVTGDGGEGVENYETLAREMDSFIDRLEQAHENSPDSERFHIEMEPEGRMQIVDGVVNLRLQDHSYFTLFREMVDPSRPDRFRFVTESMTMTEQHRAMGWDTYLSNFFEPRASSRRRAP